MAGRDPTRPQLEFPELVAELITQLRLTGQLGRLNFSDEVIPAFLIGSRGIDFGGAGPAFASSAVFAGVSNNPAADTIIADTGPLPAGTYDVFGSIAFLGNFAVLADSTVSIQHRDAANVANLATLILLPAHTVDRQLNAELPLMSYILGTNERLRIRTGSQAFVGGISGTLFAQIRPTP